MAFNNNDNDGGEAVDNADTRRRLEVAIKTLKGSHGNMLQTIMSFGAAVALCVTGVLHSQLSLRERAFFGLAAASCTSQAFTLSKTVRDWHISSLPGFENTKLMRGSHLWYLQVWASFIISLVLSFYALSSSSSHPEWAGTDGAFLVVTTFTLSATLALAKSVRDRTDAAAFAALDKRMPAQADRSELLESVLVTCQGTAGNTVATVLSLVLSVVITLYGASSMPELTFERVYMTLLPVMLFMMYSSFNLAKLIRDRMEGATAGNHAAYQFMVVLSFVLSCGFAMYFVSYMSLPYWKAKFLYASLLFMLASVLSVAKLIRDRQELAASVRRAHQD